MYAVVVLLQSGRRSASPPYRDTRRGWQSVAIAAYVPERRRVLHAGVAFIVGVLVLAPVVAAPLLGLITHPSQPAAFAGNFQVYSWSPLNMVRRDFFTADGHLAYSLPNGLYYAIAPANPAFFGPLLAVWVLPGLWAVRQWPLRISVLLVGWAAVVFAFHAGAPWQNFRFTLAYLPPLAILAAWGIRVALRWVGNAPRPRTVIFAWTVLGLFVGAGFGVRLVERFIDSKDQELALVRWVDSQTPDGAQLFSFGPTLAFRHYSSLTTFDLFDVTPLEIDDILAKPAPDYVLVDTSSIEGQWLNQAPWSNFHLLRDRPGLTEVGTAGGYTLFRVGAPPR
jgi:hypothetical protein